MAAARQDWFGRWIDFTTDVDRLEQEGPTLKNVSDNLRSIAVVIAMLVAGFALARHSSVWMVGVGYVWVLWVGAYAVPAAMQAGFLFMMGLDRVFRLKQFVRTAWNESDAEASPAVRARAFTASSLVLVVALITLAFMLAVGVVILSAVDQVTCRQS